MTKRIGLAWDLGAGRGHAVRLAVLARELQRAGHEPILFARNLRSQRAALEIDAPLLPAPHNDWIPQDAAPASWADILWTECGLHDEAQAIALACAWRDQLATSGVQALLVDAAPLAHLAASSLGIRSIAIGTGFLVPPPGPPWPVFRNWEAVDASRIATRETALRARLRALQQALGLPRSEIFDSGDAQVLFTHARFDHYPQRERARYVGPLLGTGEAPTWPAGSRRVFVYLQPGYAPLPALHAALLQQPDVAVLAYFGGRTPWPDAPTLRVVSQAQDMHTVLAQAQVVVAQGGNLAVAAASHGVPALLLPTQAEMFLTARRIEDLGVALTVLAPADTAQFAQALQRLLDEPAFALAGQGIALDHDRHDTGRRDDDVIAREVLDLLLGR